MLVCAKDNGPQETQPKIQVVRTCAACLAAQSSGSPLGSFGFLGFAFAPLGSFAFFGLF